MKRLLSIIFMIVLGCTTYVRAQEYVAPPVTVSRQTVKNNGKVYYSHVVLERQTLFSISKAYGVTVDEICDANPTLNLKTEGLKKNQILFIPTESAAAAEQLSQPQVQEEEDDEDYIVHIKKWYEDLASIAKKYKVSQEVLIAFNNLTSTTLSNRQEIKIPLHPEKVKTGMGEVQADIDVTEETQDIVEEETVVQGEPAVLTSRKVNAALILPFNSSDNPNENQFDFYSGVLLAVKDLAEEGIDIDLSTYDCAKGMPVTNASLAQKDFVIGPVGASDINSLLAVRPEQTMVISPLDPKGAAIAAANRNMVQAPSSTDAQCIDAINWLASELKSRDKVFVFTEKSAALTASSSLLINELKAKGIEYRLISYGILEGRNIINTISRDLAQGDGVNRIVIASESQAFVNDVVRNVNLLIHEKNNAIIYSTSKIRTFDTIEVEHFHNSSLRVSLSYYIDYSNPRVQRFLMAYRALYGAEPSQFSYQGYDIAYNFLKLRATYGDFWPVFATEKRMTGLQSDFLLEKSAEGGYTNKAVRRIVYGPDYSVNSVSQ